MSDQRLPRGLMRGARGRWLAGFGVAVIAGLATWLILRGGDEERTTGPSARIVSTQALAGFAGSTGFPVFWAGERAGLRHELTSTPDARVYVRYLPAGVEAGDRRARFLSVATYSVARAYAALTVETRRPGAVSFRLPGDGIAMYNKARPTNVYLAYRTLPVQVEVFDPSAARALTLVKGGQIRPIGPSGAGAVPVGPSLVSTRQLRRFAPANGAPVFWAGPRAGSSYELTRTTDGRVYLRYLPSGVRAGDRRARFLTIGTYPVRDGLEAIRTAAREQRMTRVPLAGGALAVYRRSKPKSVYYATPRSPVEVEVFSPTPGLALQLAAASRIVPVR
jgi:hypothetical protein